MNLPPKRHRISWLYLKRCGYYHRVSHLSIKVLCPVQSFPQKSLGPVVSVPKKSLDAVYLHWRKGMALLSPARPRLAINFDHPLTFRFFGGVNFTRGPFREVAGLLYSIRISIIWSRLVIVEDGAKDVGDCSDGEVCVGQNPSVAVSEITNFLY